LRSTDPCSAPPVQVPLLPMHRESAIALWRQRLRWLSAPGISGRAMERLEYRLRLHLHVLSRVPDAAEEAPAQGEAAFVRLAAALLATDRERRARAAGQALTWLAEAPRRDAARWALALCPGGEVMDAMRGGYARQPGLRALLVEIWRIQGAAIPRELLDPAEPHAGGPELQAALLRYQADRPETGIGAFRPWYHGSGRAPGGSPSATAAIVEALRGGLLRRDPEAPVALRRAIEAAAEAEARSPLLRLAALSGDAAFHPVLQAHARAEPATGFPLLALWGRREAVADLLPGLESPRDNPHAARAWARLTGHELPRRPRIRLAEGGEGRGTAGGAIADPEAAVNWWQAHRGRWPAKERRAGGRRLDVPAVRARLEAEAGLDSADALDLVGVITGRPVGVAAGTWHRLRRRALAAAAVAMAAGEQAARA